jgi:protein TonB
MVLHAAALGAAGAVSSAAVLSPRLAIMAQEGQASSIVLLAAAAPADVEPRLEPLAAVEPSASDPAALELSAMATAEQLIELLPGLGPMPDPRSDRSDPEHPAPELAAIEAAERLMPATETPLADRIASAAVVHVPPVPVAPEPQVPNLPPAHEGSAFVEAEPMADRNAPPEYPPRARVEGHEGVVKIRVEVAADGSVVGAEIVEACAFPELNRAALRAVRSWWFRPAERRGVAVADVVTVPIVFRLRREGVEGGRT